MQIIALENAGCERIFTEKQSGTTTKGRDELANCLSYMRVGDTLAITRIDRLARSLRDLKNLVYELECKEIKLRAIEQPIDTSTAAGELGIGVASVYRIMKELN